MGDNQRERGTLMFNFSIIQFNLNLIQRSGKDKKLQAWHKGNDSLSFLTQIFAQTGCSSLLSSESLINEKFVMDLFVISCKEGKKIGK